MTNTITKISQLHLENDDIWHDVYEVPGLEGKRITVAVPRETREPGNLRKALLRGGAVVPSLNHSSGALIEASEAAAPVVHQAGRTGWRDADKRFVAHAWVVGDGANEVTPPSARLARVAGDLDLRGTLDGWKEIVAMATYSTAMIVALCVVFAAPLLRLLRSPSFGLVLVGPSRSGKSSAQLIAASALGFGQEEHLPTLNATPAGLSETALVFNDHMLPINEVGTARGPKRDVHAVLRDATYAVMSGRDTIRHSSWGGGTALSSSFHVLPLLSSEHSPDEWAARGGESRDDGETARLIGVPVLYGASVSVFDVYPKVAPDQRPAWDRTMFERLRNGLPEHHGIAFKVYIEAMTSDLAGYVEQALKDAATFRNRAARWAVTPIKRDIAAKFAVLYAGGMAAIDAKVLPLEEERLMSALVRACRAALAALPDRDADLKDDLRTLKEHLESGGIIDADEASTTQKRMMKAADGYHEKFGIGCLYTLQSANFPKLFASASRTRKVLEWLDDQGHLRHSRDRKPGLSNEWAQTHGNWPDGTHIRSFKFYFPGELDVLDLD